MYGTALWTCRCLQETGKLYLIWPKFRQVHTPKKNEDINSLNEKVNLSVTRVGIITYTLKLQYPTSHIIEFLSSLIVRLASVTEYIHCISCS